MQNENGDLIWMQEALSLAQLAEAHDEVPIGCVIVYGNQIIGRGYNQPRSTNDPTAHAEIIALREAANTLDNYRLLNCRMYVTVEPCLMCVGAIIHARIEKIYFAVKDPKTGAICSIVNALDDLKHNHHIDWECGILAEKSAALLQSFFQHKRLIKKNQKP